MVTMEMMLMAGWSVTDFAKDDDDDDNGEGNDDRELKQSRLRRLRTH